MKTKIRVTEEQIQTIEKYKKYILMDNFGHLYVIQDYTITEEEEKPLISFNNKPKMVKYLTDAVVQCYRAEGDFRAVLIGLSLEEFFSYRNFDEMRVTWRTFTKELQSFGFNIIKTPKEELKEESK